MASKLSGNHSDGLFRLITSTGVKGRHDIHPGHSCRHVAQLMALTHNTIFRGLNMVYHWAPLLKPESKEAIDLLRYSAVACRFIQTHHAVEEEIFFPKIETATGTTGIMKENVEQHREFKRGLEALQVYAEDSRCFDAKTVRSLIEGFARSFEQHLHDEIPSILNLHDKIDSATLAKIYHEAHTAAAQRSNKIQTGPFVMGNQDNTFLLDDMRIRFPEVPVIANLVVDQLISIPHRSLWYFNWSDMYGNPRPCSQKRSTAAALTTGPCGPGLRFNFEFAQYIFAVMAILACFIMATVLVVFSTEE